MNEDYVRFDVCRCDRPQWRPGVGCGCEYCGTCAVCGKRCWPDVPEDLFPLPAATLSSLVKVFDSSPCSG